MIRPWYRSRLFWLGVPGLVFLMWLWWDSMNHSTTIWLSWEGVSDGSVFGPATEGFSVTHEWGSIHLGLNEDPFWPMPTHFGMGCEMSRISTDVLMHDPFADPVTQEAVEWNSTLSDWFPSAFSLSVVDDPFSPDVGPRVAIWFLIMVYAASWAGACFAWQRWKRRDLGKVSS